MNLHLCLIWQLVIFDIFFETQINNFLKYPIKNFMFDCMLAEPFHHYELSPCAIFDLLTFNLRDKLIIYVRTFKKPLVSKILCESVLE